VGEELVRENGPASLFDADAMAMTLWFSSDLHFDHANLVTNRPDKPASRPQFGSVQEMGEFIVNEHNKIVKPNDYWYCLGDVAMAKHSVEWVKRMNGHRRLVMGNHDVHGHELYLECFEKIMAFREFDGMMFTHAPVAPWSHRWTVNVHGHCHRARPLFYSAADPTIQGFSKALNYINLSMEHTGYRPVTLEQIKMWARTQRS